MKDIIGDSRQVRDPHDRCPPSTGYSFSRVPKHIDDRPDSYDYDDQWFETRTRGYSPGHVRSLSPPPGERTGSWLGKLESVDSTVSFDDQTYRQSFTRGQPVLETRYSSITLGKEWSKFRAQRVKENKVKKEIRDELARRQEENIKHRDETYKYIADFEKNAPIEKRKGHESDDEDF